MGEFDWKGNEVRGWFSWNSSQKLGEIELRNRHLSSLVKGFF